MKRLKRLHREYGKITPTVPIPIAKMVPNDLWDWYGKFHVHLTVLYEPSYNLLWKLVVELAVRLRMFCE
jgi:hypothetical protein